MLKGGVIPVMFVRVTLAVPLLVMIRNWSWALWPTLALPKFMVRVFTSRVGVTPCPLKATLLFWALDEIMKPALELPTTVGL